MLSVYQLKPLFQNSLRPLVRKLAERGVTANQVTLAAIFLSFLTGIFVFCPWKASWPFFAVPVVLFIRMALNAMDGMLAREHDMKSPLGAILNELGDVFSDIFLYLPLIRLETVSGFLVFWVLLLSVVSEMAGVLGVQIGASRRYEGPMGKSDRALVFGVLYLILGLGATPRTWINLVLLVLLFLLGWTIWNRVKAALSEAKP